MYAFGEISAMKVCGCLDLFTLRRLSFIIVTCVLMVSYAYFRVCAKYSPQRLHKLNTFGMRDDQKRPQDIQDLLMEHGEDTWHSQIGTPISNKAKHIKLPMPECDNVLNNLTRGRWVRKTDLQRYQNQFGLLVKEEERLETELRVFWVERGIQTAFWREDFRCGHYIYESQPPKTPWPKVGSWCNPKGERPCCSNKWKGTCMKPSRASCNCNGCVDMRNYKYAETSEWIVADSRCKWRDYNAAEICQVIEDSPFSDIHFVGDSFMRNMFRTFTMMVTNDFVHGAVNSSTSLAVRNRCTRMQQYFWAVCRKTISDVSKTLNPKKLCGGRGYLNFSAELHGFYSTKFRENFLKLVHSKINVPGSMIVLSIGFHMQCTSSIAIQSYLDPAVRAINEYYGSPPAAVNPRKLSGRWPQIFLCLPLSIGLLKPTHFLSIQNEVKCDKYCSEMKAYSRMNDIRVLDFRELTKLVYSFDGTHHGINVNRMKNFILLNDIASLKP